MNIRNLKQIHRYIEKLVVNSGEKKGERQYGVEQAHSAVNKSYEIYCIAQGL